MKSRPMPRQQRHFLNSVISKYNIKLERDTKEDIIEELEEVLLDDIDDPVPNLALMERNRLSMSMDAVTWDKTAEGPGYWVDMYTKIRSRQREDQVKAIYMLAACIIRTNDSAVYDPTATQGDWW